MGFGLGIGEMALIVIIGLCYVAVPVGAVILLIYFFRQRRREKKKEAEKNYDDY